jgi:hypothetical protein
VTRNQRETVAVQNVKHPGKVRDLDATMYQAMRRAFLKILPWRPPGLTPPEIVERIAAHLPEALFPGGARAGWWARTVQLDLEAKGVIVRDASRPLRLRRSPPG